MTGADRAASPPPQVSTPVRWLCEPWMAYLRYRGRRRMRRTVMERVCDGNLIVLQGVFNPVTFRTGKYLADFLMCTPLLDKPGSVPTALDMGCGSGILAVCAALRGYRVTAVDIDERAVLCTQMNAAMQNVLDKIKAVQGDLFAPIEGESYDLVVFSLPKFRGEPRTEFERALKSPDLIDRFARKLAGALKPSGIALFVLTNHGDPSGMLDGLAATGLSIERLTWRHFGVETMAIYAAKRLDRISTSTL